MARPTIEAEDRRDDKFTIRLTDTERLRLECKADQLGLSLAEFIRNRGLGYRMPRRAAQRQTDALAIVALNRIGNNLNQVAHHLNAGWATAGTGAALQLICAELQSTMRGLCRGPKDSGQQQGL